MMFVSGASSPSARTGDENIDKHATTKATKALERYERSAELDPTYPDPFRQLGFLYYQQKENLRAKEAFQKYLALKPDAPDALRIKEYLVEIDR